MKNRKYIMLFLATGIAISSAAQVGSLDNSFNSNGKVTTNIGGSDGITDMVIQPDGKIVSVGYSSISNTAKFGITRCNPNGILDASFGVSGIVTTAITTGFDQAFAVALQTDGKIVVGGSMWVGNSSNIAVVRYNSDGALDNTFGNGGIVSVAIGTADCGASDLIIQPDGKIVFVSNATIAAIARDFAIARLNPDGSLDNSFGSGGITSVDINNDDNYVFTLAMQADGKFIMAGMSANNLSGASDFAFCRVDSSGNLDATYGTNGTVVTDFGKYDEWATGAVIQPDGKLLLGGITGSPYKVSMARYDTLGVLDLTFNGTGMVTQAFTTHDNCNAITLDTAGNIIAVGVSNTGTSQNFLVSRFLTSGVVDSTFGNNGFVNTDFSNGIDKANAVALQQDGKIVVGGLANADFALARYQVTVNTGLIDFATMDTKVMVYPNPVTDIATLSYSLNKADAISISLTDAQGKMITSFITNQKQTTGAQQLTIAMPANLPQGNYYVVITNGSEQFSVKLIK